jgi:hypothetical protein
MGLNKGVIWVLFVGKPMENDDGLLFEIPGTLIVNTEKQRKFIENSKSLLHSASPDCISGVATTELSVSIT